MEQCRYCGTTEQPELFFTFELCQSCALTHWGVNDTILAES
jgi:hypothetical protein